MGRIRRLERVSPRCRCRRARRSSLGAAAAVLGAGVCAGRLSTYLSRGGDMAVMSGWLADERGGMHMHGSVHPSIDNTTRTTTRLRTSLRRSGLRLVLARARGCWGSWAGARGGSLEGVLGICVRIGLDSAWVSEEMGESILHAAVD